MKSTLSVSAIITALWLISSDVCAHFLAFFPEKQVIDAGDSRKLHFPIHFTHPSTQGPLMSIERPVSAGYMVNGTRVDLTEELKPVSRDGKSSWQLSMALRRPGTYTFFTHQAPYLDPTEDVVITQYAKVIVDAFAAMGEWQHTLGNPVEIIPLTRPFALWTNSLFTGRVLSDGRPAANVSVEIEYYNDTGVKIPSDAWASQEVRTNGMGEFSVSLPFEGWWGIAALVADDKPITVQGKKYEHEQAGVIWLQVQDMK
ncbi:DUF4198 domain-containing protein [uncultured Shewanella sp.]|uniref:DUF4198 domain-containing protein n=1 Tax=Shewanella atlantica TaxID=271099 RepID=UPI00262371FA|nr:DUF4198 domain-containing protein [uncultured Shewanella sp.]